MLTKKNELTKWTLLMSTISIPFYKYIYKSLDDIENHGKSHVSDALILELIIVARLRIEVAIAWALLVLWWNVLIGWTGWSCWTRWTRWSLWSLWNIRLWSKILIVWTSWWIARWTWSAWETAVDWIRQLITALTVLLCLSSSDLVQRSLNI